MQAHEKLLIVLFNFKNKKYDNRKQRNSHKHFRT